ncbi:hypothetical protein PCURB6_03380 [Paenibacillus curdlanolyticus]|nr:hypothetical protein PCURB6_03380 [Paenibacillus curdlanolyticus]
MVAKISKLKFYALVAQVSGLQLGKMRHLQKNGDELIYPIGRAPITQEPAAVMLLGIGNGRWLI